MLFQSSLQVDRLIVPIADLPDRLHGLTIVQMSDFHYDGRLLNIERLTEAIVASNRTNPDLVVLTGDFVSHKPEPITALAQQLKNCAVATAFLRFWATTI